MARGGGVWGGSFFEGRKSSQLAWRSAAYAPTGLGAPRGRGAAPGGQICCTSPELDFGRHRAPRPLVSRGRSRELVYRGTAAYHVGAERQGTHSPRPLTFVQHSLFSSGVTAASKKRLEPEESVQARRLRHPWDRLASCHGVRAQRATASPKKEPKLCQYTAATTVSGCICHD